MRTPVVCVVVVITFAGLVGTGHAAVSWPSSSDWKPLTVSGASYTDPHSDVNPTWTDIVGTATYPSGFWFYDEAEGNLHFRLRLNSGPNANPQTVWQILLDTDTDSNIDWVLQRDDSGGNIVELVQATTGGPLFSSVVLSTTPSWTGSRAVFSRFVVPTGDSSAIDNNADAFLDLAVPWSAIASATGLGLTDAFRLGVSSSSTHSGINKDLPGTLSSSSNVSGGYADAIRVAPEPTGLWLAGVGFLILFALRRRHSRRCRDSGLPRT